MIWRATLNNDRRLIQLCYMDVKLVFFEPIDFSGPEVFSTDIQGESWVYNSDVEDKYMKFPHTEISNLNSIPVLVNHLDEIEEVHLSDKILIAKTPIPGVPLRKDVEGNCYVVRPIANDVILSNDWIVAQNKPDQHWSTVGA